MNVRLVIFVLAVAFGGPVSAQQYSVGDLRIERPWARALPPVAPNGAAYFRIENGGSSPDHIVSAHSPIAERAEFHLHESNGGLMTMRHVHSVEVPPQGSVAFEPEGLHVMLFGLRKPLVDGESFPLVLGLRNAGEIEVAVEIKGAGTSDHSGHAGHHRGSAQ